MQFDLRVVSAEPVCGSLGAAQTAREATAAGVDETIWWIPPVTPRRLHRLLHL